MNPLLKNIIPIIKKTRVEKAPQIIKEPLLIPEL